MNFVDEIRRHVYRVVVYLLLLIIILIIILLLLLIGEATYVVLPVYTGYRDLFY